MRWLERSVSRRIRAVQDGLRCRWSVTKRAVWPDGVVVPAPLFDQNLRLLQCVEDFSVQQLIAQLTVEALVVTVLPWRSRLDEQGLHTDPCQPVSDSNCRELAAIVRADMIRRTVPGEQLSQAREHIVVSQSAGNGGPAIPG
jgi:hypothetical protein